MKMSYRPGGMARIVARRWMLRILVATLPYLIPGLSPNAALAQQMAALSLDAARDGQWQAAIGLVAIRGGRQNCTGTLVAPDRVLTASHCLNHEGNTVAPSDIVFRPGTGCAKGICPSAEGMFIKSVLAIGRPVANGTIKLSNVPGDWAILLLVRPVDAARPLVMRVADPADIRRDLGDGAILYSAGYGSGRFASLRKLDSCRFLSPSAVFIPHAYRVMVMGCHVAMGDSGSPIILIGRDGSPVIVGVISGNGRSLALKSESGLVLVASRDIAVGASIANVTFPNANILDAGAAGSGAVSSGRGQSSGGRPVAGTLQ